jgi:hypothetical protein
LRYQGSNPFAMLELLWQLKQVYQDNWELSAAALIAELLHSLVLDHQKEVAGHIVPYLQYAPRPHSV